MAWKYTKALHDADAKLADERELHRREIDSLNKRYESLLKESNEVHFEQLNENAKRTIEERGHFPSNEAYEPFRELVMKFIASHEGVSSGIDKSIALFIKANTIILGLIGLGLTIYGLIK
jgi:hypothetical protein